MIVVSSIKKSYRFSLTKQYCPVIPFIFEKIELRRHILKDSVLNMKEGPH